MNFDFPHKLTTGNRLPNGAWVLDAKESPAAFEMQAREDRHVQYKYIVLTFHSGAGAQEPFATGRADEGGRINPISYIYFPTLPKAMFDYTYERG